MAEIKKTSIRRYNGTDWDTIYLATTSDIVTLGLAITVADNTTAWQKGDVLPASETVKSVLEKIVNRVQYIDNTSLPAIRSGEDITALAANKITGVLANSQLPEDVHGNFFTGVTDSGKDDAAFVATLKVGDIVKTTEGKVYGVKAISSGTVTWVALSDDAAAVAWSRITGRPTTVTTNSADASDPTKLYLSNVAIYEDLLAENSATKTADAGKGVKLGADGNLHFDITGDAGTLDGHDSSYFATKSWADGIDTEIGADATSGTIKGRIKALEDYKGDAATALNLDQIIAGTGTLPMTVIPKGAQEQLYPVSSISVMADKSAAGYPTDAGNGDTILAEDTLQMYYVKDETKLGTAQYMDGLAGYQAGKASSVEWANVLNTPTTLAGYGITDAVNSNEKVTTASAANAGKILVLNANGKLDVDVTGDAGTLDGHNSAYFATKSWADGIDTAIGDDSTAASIKGRIKALETTVGDSASGLVKDVADLQSALGDSSTSGTVIYRLDQLESGDSIQALAASKLTGTVSRSNLPDDVSGKVVVKANAAALSTMTTADINKGDILKLTDDNSLYVYMGSDPTAIASYTNIYQQSSASIAWDQITGIPTTIIKSGTPAAGEALFTNAVISSDVTTTAINASLNDGHGAGDSTKSGKLVSVNAQGKLEADVTHLGGHTADFYALKEYASTAAAGDAEVGQMILIPVGAN